MSRKVKFGLITIISFLMLLIVLVFAMHDGDSNSSNKKSVKKISYSNWDEKFELSSKEPFGLIHWNNALKLHLHPKQSISTIDYLYSIDTIPRSIAPTFMFIGEHFVAHEEEIDSLLHRVEKGANLFIAAEQIDGILLRKLFRELSEGFYYDTTVTIVSERKSYEFEATYQGFTIAKEWKGYKNYQIHDSLDMTVLSGFGTLTNSMQLQLGQGYIYLNTTPYLFTNVYFLSKNGLAYSTLWLDRIPQNQSVYWLEFTRFTPVSDDYYDSVNDSDRNDSSYLQYVFQHQNRVIAMLLLAIGVLLFILFRAKRMQPIVPLIAKKRNMTLLFADTITSIYFNHRNPFTMVQIQQANFFSTINKHFHIDFSKDQSEKAITALAQKSTISPQEITRILEQFKTLKQYNTTEQDLTHLRSTILNFYRNSGLISARILKRLEEKEYNSYRNEWISGLFIISGIVLIIYGMFLLTNAIAIGILFWPLGALPIIIGILRLIKPFYSWTNSSLIFTPLIGKKSQYSLQELEAINQNERQIQLQFGQKIVQINFWELNQSDAKQLKRFALNHNKLK